MASRLTLRGPLGRAPFLASVAAVAALAGFGLAGSDYDTGLRPRLTLQVISEMQRAGVEPDIWIESENPIRTFSGGDRLVLSGGKASVVHVVDDADPVVEAPQDGKSLILGGVIDDNDL